MEEQALRADVAYQMVVTQFKDGNVRVDNVPGNLEAVLGTIAGMTKAVVSMFVQKAMDGELSRTTAPSRLVIPGIRVPADVLKKVN